LQQQRSGGVA